MRAMAQFTISESNDSFTHIRYAMDSTGLGMTDKPSLLESSGRNYLTNSTGNFGVDGWTRSGLSDFTVINGGNPSNSNNSLKLVSDSNASARRNINKKLAPDIIQNGTVQGNLTLSFWYKAEPGNLYFGVGGFCRLYTSDSTILIDACNSTNKLIIDGNWHYSSFSNNQLNYDTVDTVIVFLFAFQGTVEYSDVIVSFGEHPWSPAPEDYPEDYVQPYIGITTTNNPDAPTDPTAYTWSKFMGDNAVGVDITASSQVFKSSDGGITFSPDMITLTPMFQGGLSFNRWQYSINGGSTWIDVTSGSNGLTVSSDILTIVNSSPLYTKSVTSISFKCISSNIAFYDTITVLKIYDTTDMEYLGVNLVRNSNTLLFEDYFFYGTLIDEQSNLIVDEGNNEILALL